MFCANCASPYASPYVSIPNCQMNSPAACQTVDPNLSPACMAGIPPTTTFQAPPQSPPQPQPLPSSPIPPPPQLPLYRYQNVNALPTASIYGHQGPNASIICGQRPLTSIVQQPLFNPSMNCVSTESKLDTNVSNYDFYQNPWSAINPVNKEVLPILQAIWDPKNIALIKRSVECMLTQVFGKDFGVPIEIEDNAAFRQTISDVLIDNPRWAYDVENGLPLLNNVVINREFSVHQSAIRQQLLYEKYVIRNDRQKFMPYAQSDHVVKGETIIDPSSYSLNTPAPISYDCFLTQANLWCKK